MLNAHSAMFPVSLLSLDGVVLLGLGSSIIARFFLLIVGFPVR